MDKENLDRLVTVCLRMSTFDEVVNSFRTLGFKPMLNSHNEDHCRLGQALEAEKINVYWIH